MATDFNAVDWAQINAPRVPERNFNADFAEAVETREGFRSGMNPNQAVMRGMRARQTVLDPMYELKKTQAMLNIATTAQQFQENILSNEIKRKQIDEEAEDNLSFSRIAQLPDWEQRMTALNTITPKSARGIQQATQMRLQLAQLRQMDAASKALAKLTPQQMAVVSQFEQGSPDWWNAIREVTPADNKPQGIAITLPSGRTVEAVYNAKGGGYTLVADPEAKLEGIRDQLDAKEKSALSLFYNKEAAKLEAEAAELSRSTRESDKKAAEGLKAQAQTYRQKLAGFGQPEASPASTAAPTTPQFQEGQRVRNKRTGQMGTVKNGEIVPDPQ